MRSIGWWAGCALSLVGILAGCNSGPSHHTPPPPAFDWTTVGAIQGDGLVSPMLDRQVETKRNVVTAVDEKGFFMQSAPQYSDGDPSTSDGIFVYTGQAPTVKAGDNVTVTGIVAEFHEMTQLSGEVTVTLEEGAAATVTPVLVDGLPFGDDWLPANWEAYEGMLLKITAGKTTGPTDKYGNLFVVTGDARPFREPGIKYPGVEGLPVWDGNPELLTIVSNAFGGEKHQVPGGATVQAEGPLSYQYDAYRLLPTKLEISAPAASEAVRPVRGKMAGEFTIGSTNLYWLFDDVDDGGDRETIIQGERLDTRLKKLAMMILDNLHAPDILAVQEVENQNALKLLAEKVQSLDPAVVYKPYVEGVGRPGQINVGFLVRDDVTVTKVEGLGKDAVFTQGGETQKLHLRPPLLLHASFKAGGVDQPMKVISVHLKSMLGLDGPDGESIRARRLAQATDLARHIQKMQTDDPNCRLVVLGDFNTFEFTDGYTDMLGVLTGQVTEGNAMLPGEDVLEPNLINLVLRVPAADRYSYVYQGNAQVLDHALITQALEPFVTDINYARGNADQPESLINDAGASARASDHDPLVIYLKF